MAARPKVRYATIFVFPGGAKGKVRVNATPETLTVRPGDVVDWTVVNAASDASAGRVSDRLEGSQSAEGRARRSSIARRGPGCAPRPGPAATSTASCSTARSVFDPEIEVMN